MASNAASRPLGSLKVIEGVGTNDWPVACSANYLEAWSEPLLVFEM